MSVVSGTGTGLGTAAGSYLTVGGRRCSITSPQDTEFSCEVRRRSTGGGGGGGHGQWSVRGGRERRDIFYYVSVRLERSLFVYYSFTGSKALGILRLALYARKPM